MKSHKDLKEEYKQIKFQMGVFQIRNCVNGKLFVGSSVNLPATWNSQKFQLNQKAHMNSELQKDWNEFGESNFVFEIIDEIKHREDGTCDYRDEVKELEKMYLEEIQPFNEKGYNKKPLK